VFAVLALRRAGGFSTALSYSIAAVAGVLVGVGLMGLDRTMGAGRSADARTLDQRGLELSARSMAPGSVLACLDAPAGDTVIAACEKAVFAQPETVAAAVSYVAAQLDLLMAVGARASDEGAIAGLRRSAESDRFGIVAHVLASRYGCTPEACEPLKLLRVSERVQANLSERAYETNVTLHAAAWPGGPAHVAGTSSSAAPGAGASSGQSTVPAASALGGLNFPSAASIPPVSIMEAEPPPPPPQAAPRRASPPAPAPAQRRQTATSPPPVSPPAGAPVPIVPTLPPTAQ
jgi:hypothetical protein